MQYRNVKLNQVEMSKTTSGQNFARGTILLPEDNCGVILILKVLFNYLLIM